MDLGLTNKIAIVTGSSRGLGLAVARSLAAEGCRVSMSARGEAQLLAAEAEIAAVAGGPGKTLAVVADVTKADGVQAVVDRTVAAFGGIDILVNNVGLAGGGGLLETSDEQWQEAFDQTLLPAVRASKLVVPHMPTTRRRHRHHRVDLRARSRRADDVQRPEGRGDQPRQVSGATVGALEYPSE